jgi:hypothetical protein
VRVAEQAVDGWGQDGTDAGLGLDDLVRVGVVVEMLNPGIELVDFCLDGCGRPHLGFDVGGKLGEVDLSHAVERQRLCGSAAELVDQDRPVLAPAGRGHHLHQPRRRSPQQLAGVGVAAEHCLGSLGGQAAAERVVVAGAEQLQQRGQPIQAADPLPDQLGPAANRAAQRICRPQIVAHVQPIGCSNGSRASSTESSRSFLVCLW